MSDPNCQELDRQEYEAMIAGCGLAALKRWSQVRVEGADQASFLHNMCTNDIAGISPGGMCEAFFTDVKGKIVAHVFVMAQSDHLLLVGAPGQSEAICSHLDRYIIREDVTLSNETNDYVWSIVSGKESRMPLAQLMGGKVELSRCDDAEQTIVECSVGSADMLLAQANLCRADAFLIRSKSSEWQAMTEAFVEVGGTVCQPKIFDTLRIESSWPLMGVDFDSTNLPQEIDRDRQAIHFNKGCYLGQETIARIDALGHVNRQVRLVKFDGKKVPPAGTKLLANTSEVGKITSSCWSPRENAPLGLAMIRRESSDFGKQVTSDFGKAVVISV